MYVVPSTSLGKFDEQIDWAPELFYYYLLEYGDIAEANEITGGLLITPVPGAAVRVTSTRGVRASNKIGDFDLAPGESFHFQLDLENLPSPISTKLYFDLVVE